MQERMVIWRGVSQIDGVSPVVVLAPYGTAGNGSSHNRKTGDMIQTWILREDIAPNTAVREGKDTAICGACPHRSTASGGSGACYVIPFQAPLAVWRAYKRGGGCEFDLSVFAGHKVRFGAYGDPAAAPFEIWEAIAQIAAAVIGYTHAWRYCDPRFSRYCMASADSVEDRRAARLAGYRSFWVRPAGTPKPLGVVPCPASAEAGKRTTCSQCLQCGGTSNGRRADITIQAHGANGKRFMGGGQ
jgi:hypothetical protein